MDPRPAAPERSARADRGGVLRRPSACHLGVVGAARDRLFKRITCPYPPHSEPRLQLDFQRQAGGWALAPLRGPDAADDAHAVLRRQPPCAATPPLRTTPGDCQPPELRRVREPSVAIHNLGLIAPRSSPGAAARRARRRIRSTVSAPAFGRFASGCLRAADRPQTDFVPGCQARA